MTELIWDGKYDAHGKKQGPVRIALPFQTVETVNESAQDRRRNLELFASGRDTEWRNRLIWGDKKYVLPSLVPEFTGKVNLIYVDPPFATGADFSFTTNIPDHFEDAENEITRFRKEPSVLEQKAYRDTWGRGLDSYLEWVYATIVFLRELLAETGSIYVHCDSGVNSYIRAILDVVLGAQNFRNEITWKRRVGMSSSVHESNRFGICTDTVFFYAASDDTSFVPQYNKNALEYQEYIEARFTLVDENGRRFQATSLVNPAPRPNLTYEYKGYKPPRNGWMISKEKMEQWDREGKLYFPNDKNARIRRKSYADELKGMPVQNLWTDIAEVNSRAEERIGYPTQKPEALLERILRASSHEGDLVLDCFCGSGTSAVVAEKLHRRWIACDLSRFAIHTTRKRLLGIPNVKPFAVQNLGKYERQAWQAAEFPTNGKNRLEEQCQREAAYRKFILDLHHAKPVTGYPWLHGAKGGRMVHVAAVDAPVTQADVKAIAREAWKAIGSGKDAPTKAGVDILGWDFALDLNETAKQAAAESRVDVSFKKIPREVLDKKAVEQGDVRFFELGALSLDLKQKSRSVTLMLTDFVIPTDDIPDEARKAIKHWSQLVDYWAVDWDFRNDTFHNQWQAYRTRKDPKIELATSYEYKEPGKYQIVVKVIDILGNDTTKTLDLTLK